MSSSNRAIARLPLHIFTDLVLRDNEPYNPIELREAMSIKLGRMKSAKEGSLTSGGITTVGELFRMTNPALLRILDPLLTHVEIQEFVYRIYILCTPRYRTAKELCDTIHSPTSSQVIPSHLHSLDKALRGGIRIGTVTEIVGKAGVGKTQLSMQLCVNAAKYKLGSIYIDTERKLSVERLLEIGHERSKLEDINIDDPIYNYGNAAFSSQDMLDNIVIYNPNDTYELKAIIEKQDEDIVSRLSSSAYPVKLIIIDSIAAPIRRDFGEGTAPQRVSIVFRIAQTLKRIADQLQVAVVVINQVDKVEKYHQDNHGLSEMTAALGPSWHHCVTTRIALEHQYDPHQDDSMIYTDRGRKRIATIVKSNMVPKSSISYEVNQRGVCDFECSF